MADIEFASASKQFGDVTALDALDLRCEDGEFLVLLGSSGSGKSTALRLVAGSETPTSGDIRIDRQSVVDVAPKDRDVAMVFQSYALYPHMSVRQNLTLGLRVRKTPRAEIARRVASVAETLQMGQLLDRMPSELSGGQQQRVAVGRAIIREPRVFLMDEPLSNLDARLRLELRTELAKLHHELKTTVLYVTHDQTEAMTLADRIAILKDGVLQQLGKPLELFENPRNLHVASFLGESPMNQIPGTHRGDGTVNTASGRLTVPARISTATRRSSSRSVILGVRPESLSFCDTTTSDIQGVVSVVEPTGSTTLVVIETIAQELMVEVKSGAQPAIGDNVGLAVSWDVAHLFDASTSICLTSEVGIE